MPLAILLSLLIVFLKDIFFGLYLWQLKNYHFGRFLAHFQTENGKKILFNKLRILKVFMVILGLFAGEGFFLVVFLIYLIEGLVFVFNVLRKRVIKPIFTKKIIILFACSLSFYLLLFYYSIHLFLEADINIVNSIIILLEVFSLFFISLIVLALEPISVIGRKIVIKKATNKRSSFKNLKVIGITGSYGKSTTKEMLSFILSEKFKVIKTIENENNEMGISRTIINNLKEEDSIFVCEMAAYNVGGIKLLCDIVKPEIGILTGINSQHLSTFGSQENIIKAKYELIKSLPENGLAIFNGDNEYCFDLYKKTGKKKKVFFIDKKEGADIWAEDIMVGKENIEFKAFTKDGNSADFEVRIIGRVFVENLLSAILVAKELGMNLSEISERLKGFKDIVGISVSKTKNGADILDSTYSSNPSGFMSHLEHLKHWEGNKMVVFKPMVELGSFAKKNHEEVGEKIGEVCNMAISTRKEFFKEMKNMSVKRGMSGASFVFSNNPLEIVERLKELKEGDVVLLENKIDKKIIESIKNV